jgi:hypothetical protein
MRPIKSLFALQWTLTLSLTITNPDPVKAAGVDPNPDLWLKISEEGSAPAREVYYIRANTLTPLYTPEQIARMRADPYSNSPALAASLASTETRATRVIRIRERGKDVPELTSMEVAIACPRARVAISRTDTYATLDPSSEVSAKVDRVLSVDTAPWVKQAYLVACQEEVWRSAFLSYAHAECATVARTYPDHACFYKVECDDKRLAPLGMGCVPDYFSRVGWHLRKYTDIYLWGNGFRLNSYPVH